MGDLNLEGLFNNPYRDNMNAALLQVRALRRELLNAWLRYLHRRSVVLPMDTSMRCPCCDRHLSKRRLEKLNKKWPSE